MAITYVGNGAAAFNATLASQSISAPTLQADDFILAAVINKALANVISAPAGWTQIIQDEVDGASANLDFRYSLWWKKAVGGDSGASFSFTKATDDNLLFGGIICAFRGQDLIAPLDATTVTTNESATALENVNFNAYDPTSNDVEVVYVAFYADDATTFTTPPAGTNPTLTTRFDIETPTGTDFSIALFSGANNGASISARSVASNSTTNGTNAGVVFALAAAVAVKAIPLTVKRPWVNARRSYV